MFDDKSFGFSCFIVSGDTFSGRLIRETIVFKLFVENSLGSVSRRRERVTKARGIATKICSRNSTDYNLWLLNRFSGICAVVVRRVVLAVQRAAKPAYIVPVFITLMELLMHLEHRLRGRP